MGIRSTWPRMEIKLGDTGRTGTGRTGTSRLKSLRSAPIFSWQNSQWDFSEASTEVVKCTKWTKWTCNWRRCLAVFWKVRAPFIVSFPQLYSESERPVAGSDCSSRTSLPSMFQGLSEVASRLHSGYSLILPFTRHVGHVGHVWLTQSKNRSFQTKWVNRLFSGSLASKDLGLSENRLNPEKPNFFADHYPY